MTISDISKKYSLSADTLRYYEKIGIISKVERDVSGRRSYSQKDCNRIEFAICARAAGIAIEPLREYVKMVEAGDSTLRERKVFLIEQRERLEAQIREIEQSLDFLNMKIQHVSEKLESYTTSETAE